MTTTKRVTAHAPAPYIAATRTLPELTVRAAVLGMLLSAVLAGANAYLGLKVGLTVSAAIPAAVMSMALLRFFRRANILEHNIVQTAASAGEALAAGAIFTLPALILIGYWDDFHYLEVVLITAVGGALGTLFAIPLRRALIVDTPLRFPEGVATAEVLKAGEERGPGLRALAFAGLIAGALKLASSGFKFLAGSVGGAAYIGPAVFAAGAELSAALAGVGLIIGLPIAALVFVGGAISWLLAIPLYSVVVGLPIADTPWDAAFSLWRTRIRYLGVGAMIVGGVGVLFSLARPLRRSLRLAWDAYRARRSARPPRTEHDIALPHVLAAAGILVVPLFFVFRFIIDRNDIGVTAGTYWSLIGLAVVFAFVAGFLFAAVAAYMAGLVGSSNNPISGVTVATVLVTSLLLLALLNTDSAFQHNAARNLTAVAAVAILVGAVVCVAAAISGDTLQDFKSGQLVGATPYKQQLAQLMGVAAGAAVIAPVLSLLYSAYGLGDHLPRPDMNPRDALAAPQATLMQSIAQGVFARTLPWDMIALGALLAVVLIALDAWGSRRARPFRIPVLAVAVGLYLPFELSATVFIGGLLAYAVKRGRATGQRALLMGSGLIAGEAIIGIVLALPFAIAQSTDALRLAPAGFELASQILGVGVFGILIAWLYRTIRS